METMTIIGNGNIASVFGSRWIEQGRIVREVVGRNEAEVAQLSEEFGAAARSGPERLDGQSDVYLLAVNDDAIAEVSAQLAPTSKLVIHCSGSTPLDVIEHPRRAVVWPLQSIKSGTRYAWSELNIVLESDSDIAKVEALNMVDILGAHAVHMSKKERKQAHLVAVILNNFGNHLLHMADVLCAESGMDRRLFQALMSYTLMLEGPAGEHQTGPAIRGDETIIRQHLAQLKGHPEFQKVYESMSQSIAKSPKS